MPPGHDRLLGTIYGRSGSGGGEDDDPAAVGITGTLAIEQRRQLRIGVGHGRSFAAVGGAALAQAGTILRPAAADLPNRIFYARGQPLAALDARQVQIVVSDDRGVPLAIDRKSTRLNSSH